MPWQLSGNGRSDWSTKLIRGLKAEAAAGFQSRRERCSEPTPATPQYAAFSTYKAARVHQTSGRDGDSVAARGSRGASSDTRHRSSRFPLPWGGGKPPARISPGLERGRLHRRREPSNPIPVGRRSIGSVAV